MEALSLNLSDLIEKLSECGNEKEMILKFTAIGRDPELTIQQYPQIFDPSDEEDPTETVSLKDFCGRKGEQVEKIVIAELPACISLWVKDVDEKFLCENEQKTFPTREQSECFHNYFLPAGVYPNTVRNSSSIYQAECPSILIAFPLIRRQEFSSIHRWKLEGEKHLKDSGMSYFGPQCLFEYHYPKKNTYDLHSMPTAKQLMFSHSNEKDVLIVDQVWVTIYPKNNHLLLFTDHGLNEDRKLSYSRVDGAEHISVENFKRFKSGVILDAVLLILELSKSEKYYDYLNFYKEMVTHMQYRTHKHELDSGRALEPDFNRALTEIPIALKICQTHLDIISSLDEAVRRYKLVNNKHDRRLIVCLCNEGLDLKRKEIAKLEDLLKSVHLIRQQYFDNVQIGEQKQLKMAVEKLIAATKALTDETTAHKVVGERMEESGKCMTFLTMIAIIFLPLQLSATYFAMSDFGVAETQIMFWPTSIVITLLLVAFSIWVLGYQFVKSLFKKQETLGGNPNSE